MTIFISSGAFKTTNLGEILEISRREGLKRLELSSGLRLPPGGLEKLRRARQDGFHFLVHNYFPAPEVPFVLNLGSLDAESLSESRAHCHRAVGFCVELGSPFFSVHSGFAINAKPSQLGQDLTGAPRADRGQSQAVFIESLKELCAYAQNLGIGIAIENNVLAPFNLIKGRNELLLGVTADEMLATVEAVGAPNLGILLDVAHAKVSANALGFDADEFVRRLGPKLMAFHLSDNDGTADQNWPVTPRSWFLPHLAAFKDLPAVLESYKLDPSQIKACCQAIEGGGAAGGVR